MAEVVHELPKAELVIIPNSDHVTHLEHNAYYLEQIQKFLHKI